MKITDIRIMYNDWGMNVLSGSVDIFGGKKCLCSDLVTSNINELHPALECGKITDNTNVILTNSEKSLKAVVKDLDTKKFKKDFEKFMNAVNKDIDHDLTKFFTDSLDLICKQVDKKKIIDLSPEEKKSGKSKTFSK